MKEADLIALVSKIRMLKSEGQTWEIKSAANGCPQKLFDTLSSFSNQDDGGVIVFGISESDDYAIIGVADAEMLEKDIAEQCKQMEPPVRPLFTIAEIEGKTIVAAEIPGVPFSLRPVYYKGKGIIKGAYARVGEADEIMSPYEVYSYDAFHRGVHDDRRKVPGSDLSFLDMGIIDSYVSVIKNTRPNLAALSIDDIMKLSGIVSDGVPTLAAVMAFSHYPQAFFPQFSVTAAVVPGVSKGDASDSGAPRFLDSRRFTGNVKEMLDSAVSYVLDNVRKAIAFNGQGNRVDIPEYPAIAIREAVLNALQHRDYSVYSEGKPVRIEIYPDRIEIMNSGGAYGPLPVGKLGDIPPEARNPTLSDILEVLGISENRGSGIPAIRHAFAQAGLMDPVFISARGEFKVLFRNAAREASMSDVLEFCRVPRSREELERFTGLNRTSVYYSVIKPLTDKGLLKLTLPEKPRSKWQRFVTA